MGDRIRPGSRGGADRFSWDEIKTDKFRENYLGHSLNAPVGRWQKGKDLQWWSKDKKTGKIDMAEVAAERARIKQEEEDRRLEALGLKEKAAPELHRAELDATQKAQLFARGSTGLTEHKQDVVVYNSKHQADVSMLANAGDSGDKHREAMARIQGLGYQGADANKSRLSSVKPDHELSLDSAFQQSSLASDHAAHRGRVISAPAREEHAQSSSSSSDSHKDTKKSSSLLSLDKLTPKERERLQALLEKETSKLKKKKDKKKKRSRSRSRSRSRDKKQKRKRSTSPKPTSTSSSKPPKVPSSSSSSSSSSRHRDRSSKSPVRRRSRSR